MAKTIGEKIKARRKQLGLSQAECARRAHRARAWWWIIERANSMNTDSLELIAGVLECSPSDFLRE